MYNGIGLKTARGTGTNGYIQRNISHLKPRETPFDKRTETGRHTEAVRHTQPDAGILEHERKRRIEVQCMELRVQLEDDDAPESVIEARVADLRTALTAKGVPEEGARIGPGETHKLRAAKNAEDARMGSALNVGRDYREGDAFDRELQQQRKEERIEERRRADEQRVQRKKELEAERQRVRSVARRSRSPSPRRTRRSPTRSPTPPRRTRRSPTRSLTPSTGSEPGQLRADTAHPRPPGPPPGPPPPRPPGL